MNLTRKQIDEMNETQMIEFIKNNYKAGDMVCYDCTLGGYNVIGEFKSVNKKVKVIDRKGKGKMVNLKYFIIKNNDPEQINQENSDFMHYN